MRRWMMGTALALAPLTAMACNESPDPVAPVDTELVRAPNGPPHGTPLKAGAIYLMTNAAGPNEVIVYRRASDGTLAHAGDAATGGDGTGAGLGNQSAVALTGDGRWLLVVNPGSDDVSVFRVTPRGLELTDVEPSGGDMPISVTVHEDVVYVLNAGGDGGIHGFRMSPHGDLDPLAGSAQPLSGAGVGPAQVGFSPDGRALVVTEKATNTITSYAVDSDGVASAPMSTASAGTTPFGFAFDSDGHLIVSEAFGGMMGLSTVSSYSVADDGTVDVIDGAVPNMQTAACWIAVSGNSRFAYTTNTGSGTVSGYAIGAGGDLELLDDDGVTGVTGGAPVDADFSRGSRFLYVLESGTAEISVFGLGAGGGLTLVETVTGLPGTANGMAAW